MTEPNRAQRSAWRPSLLLAALFAAGLFVTLLFSSVRAQEEETPDEGAQTTPEATSEDIDPESSTVIRIEVNEAIQPIPEGEQFEAQVFVDDVEHLAAFDFSIAYDPEKVAPVYVETGEGGPEDDVDVSGGAPVEVLNSGQFLEDSDRGDSMSCPLHFDRTSEVTVSCNTFAPPVCVDGPAGASGSGLLATVLFTSQGGGETTLRLSDSTLALDDIEPCAVGEEDDFQVIRIPHRRLDAEISLEGGGGGVSGGVVVGVVIGVVVVVAVFGSAGLLWYRRRQQAGPGGQG